MTISYTTRWRELRASKGSSRRKLFIFPFSPYDLETDWLVKVGCVFSSDTNQRNTREVRNRTGAEIHVCYFPYLNQQYHKALLVKAET
jgi:hypothetical protein